MAKIVHFEIPADDLERGKVFYNQLFGWKIEPYAPGSEYLIIETVKGDDAAVEGGMMKRQDPGQRITNYIDVQSVETMSKKVQDLGGKVLVPKTAVPGVGYFAICMDTENNSFGLWRSDPSANLFNNSAEAFTAVLCAMISADDKYSVDEMRMVWNEIETMPVFEGYSYSELESRVFSLFGKQPSEPTAFSESEIDSLLNAAKDMLDATMREEAFKAAIKLGHADRNIEGYKLEPSKPKAAVIQKIKTIFNIADHTEDQIKKDLTPKY